MDTPAIILVRPQMGENIGAAARAMANFGLSHMRIVAPRDGWPNQKAIANASGAARILDGAMLRETVGEALSDQTHVYATTARQRGLTKPVMTPADAMADAKTRIQAGERVAVLFGPERAGLENADLIPAQTLITVPVEPDFASLNLAQCVLLLAYEWRRSSAPDPPFTASKPERPATRQEVAVLLDSLTSRLDDAGFFFPDHKRDSMIDTLENLFHRIPLTEPDIRVLHGVFKTLGRPKPGGE